MDDPKIIDAKHAMLLARIDLDEYIGNPDASSTHFQELYEAVLATTAQYVWLARERLRGFERIKELSARIKIVPAPLPVSEPQENP